MASGINDGSVLYFTGDLIFKVALIEVATKQSFSAFAKANTTTALRFYIQYNLTGKLTCQWQL